jgi:myosin heavy subunit
MTLDDKVVWVCDEEDVYVKGELVETGGKVITKKDLFDDKTISGKVNVRISRSGLVVEITINKIYPYDSCHESESADFSQLSCLNVASLFHIIRSRFQHDHFNTRVFSAVVVINPFMTVNDIMSDVESFPTLDAVEARGHVLSVAKIAMTGIDLYNQSIVLSGESGSGKSFISRLLLLYICTGNVRTKTMAACNVMEMFSSCATNLCRTSSRSLKFVRVRFKVRHCFLVICIPCMLRPI